MSTRAYRPNTPHIIHETIEGEAILVNLESGSYYSTDKTGAAIWNRIETGVTPEQLIDWVLDRYSGDPADMRAGVENLLAELEREHLIVPMETAPDPSFPMPPAPETPIHEKEGFVRPKLLKYTEMEDLLLLDPIHDVDDSGWPRRVRENPPQ